MTDATSSSPSPRRRFLRGAAIAALVGSVVTGLGFKAFAHGPMGWHRGGVMDEAHLDRMLKHLYVEIDATEAQRQQLAPIVKAAARDLLPLRAKMHDARRQAIELLSQDIVDRGALEALRAEQLRQAEQASQRLVQALADVADVLTAEQRKQLAERAGRWHGRRS